MTVLHGLVPPLCTPLREDGGIDVNSLRSLIQYQIEEGVDGVFVLGSSGEAAYLNESSRRAAFQVAAEVCPPNLGLLVGCLATTAQRVCDEIDRLEVLGAPGVDGIVITAPFYGTPSEHEIEQHFAAVKEKIEDRALYAYQIPRSVGYQIPPSVLASLCKRGIIAGYKDSSGNVAEFRSIVSTLENPSNHALFTGSDVLADVYLEVGASGLIPGLANIRPRLFRMLLDGHASGSYDFARIQRSISSLVDVVRLGEHFGLSRHAAQVGGLKHVLHRDGVIASARTSSPLEQLPIEARHEIDAVLVKADQDV